MGDYEWLYAMEPRLQLERSTLQAGLEPGTARSIGQRLTYSTELPWLRGGQGVQFYENFKHAILSLKHFRGRLFETNDIVS